MFNLLKTTPSWVELDSFPGNGASEPFAQLVGDDPVLIPANLLLAVSPLLRSMMTDMPPPVQSPLVILLPGVRGDVLQAVKELMLKGTAVMNKTLKTLVEEVFEMVSIGASFTCCTLEDIRLQNAIEIEVKIEDIDTDIDCGFLEQEECQDMSIMNTSYDGESDPKHVEEVLSDSEDSAVDCNSRSNSSGSKDGENNEDLQEMPSQVKVKKCYLKNIFIDSKVIQRRMQLDQPKVYICQECGYQSSNNRDLKRHMMRHTGEKPFRCDFC